MRSRWALDAPRMRKDPPRCATDAPWMRLGHPLVALRMRLGCPKNQQMPLRCALVAPDAPWMPCGCARFWMPRGCSKVDAPQMPRAHPPRIHGASNNPKLPGCPMDAHRMPDMNPSDESPRMTRGQHSTCSTSLLSLDYCSRCQLTSWSGL